MIENFKYDHLIKNKKELKSFKSAENGVYLLRVSGRNIYVGMSTNVFLRISRFFIKGIFTRKFTENTRLSEYFESIWVEPHPEVEIKVHTQKLT